MERREVKRTIYADFLNYLKNKSKGGDKTPNTILEVFRGSESYGYISMLGRQRSLRVNLHKPYATVYTNRDKINTIISKAKGMGYEVKEILI